MSASCCGHHDQTADADWLRQTAYRKALWWILGINAVSLLVVGAALRYRASAALAKGVTMALLGVWGLGVTVWHVLNATLPQAVVMGGVGLSALAANAASFGVLWQHRAGDANMRSAWICTRNDVLGNFVVVLAAAGVFGTGTGWPDVIVAATMGALALQGAATVIRLARSELKSQARPPALFSF